MVRTKIFVSAFSCMPHAGSEPGVGWHWILEMSNHFELWVLVHKEQSDDIEAFVKETNLGEKIHFLYFNIPFNSFFFKNKRFRFVRTYYVLWTMLSNRIVKQTMQENKIKIFHLLTFGNAIWPISKYGQKQFFIWGPIGGVETISADYSRHYGIQSQIIEIVRRLIVKILKWQPGFIKKCKNANLILCKTENMRNIVPEKYRYKAILFTDVAVEESNEETEIINHEHDYLHYISVGRLDAWRGFDVLIIAFSNALVEYPNMKLSILGDGIDRGRLESLIKRNKTSDKIKILGNVPIDDYRKIISDCDVVVNSCLKEGAVTVSFDSMLYKKPLICVDSGGYTRYFSNSYAIILPQQTRENLIKSMENSILRLTDNQYRIYLGELSHKMGSQFIWSKKGESITKAILEAYNNQKITK